MNTKEIERLIDLYWDGLTSVDEEKKICSFFKANDNLSPELEKWRNWFEGKDAVCTIELDDSFDDKVLAYVEQSLSIPRTKLVRLKYIVWSAVASIAIIGLVYFSWMEIDEPAYVAHLEVSDEEREEYEIVKELLYFTSSKINETETILDENLNKIDIMNTYINMK